MMALGHLTLQFSVLDEAITVLCARLHDCFDEELAEALVTELTFGPKLQRLSWLLKWHIRKLGKADLDGAEAFELLKRLKAIGESRNAIVHGFAERDEATGTTFVVRKQQRVELDPQKIEALAQDTLLGFRDAIRTIGPFMGELQKRRHVSPSV